MKRIFTLLASLILTISVFAAAKPKSTLIIQSIDRGDVRVVIDGRRFEPNDNYLRIHGIEAGMHRIKIYKERTSGMFSMFGRRYEVVFNSTVQIRPRTRVVISIDRSGRAIMNDGRSGNGRQDRNDRDFDNRDYRDKDFDFDRNKDAGDYSNDRDGRWDKHYAYESGMNDREFDRVLESIEKEWLESNKFKSAMHVATSNKLSTAQVKELALLFSFEKNRLDIAKQAYANTVDKRNYSMLNDVFSFSSSKEELARFIRNSR